MGIVYIWEQTPNFLQTDQVKLKWHIDDSRCSFYWCLCSSIFSFLCSVYRSLFVLFPLAIVLSLLLFIVSDYPFGIFKLFSHAFWYQWTPVAKIVDFWPQVKHHWHGLEPWFLSNCILWWFKDLGAHCPVLISAHSGITGVHCMSSIPCML
jgi:hypothetical protein